MQDYPRDRIEILIVDGMSSDATRRIIQEFQIQHSNILLLDNPNGIVPTGLNIALQHANGEIIVRVDGHTIIANDYVSQCVKVLQESGADNVGGCMKALGKSPFGEAVAFATSSPFGVGDAHFHYSNAEEWVDSVYMGAWPRLIFYEIGLFDEEMVRDQDDEFNYRLRENGGKIFLSPRIISEYSVRSTPGDLWRQYFQYGYWKVRVLQKHPLQMRLRQFIPLLFVFGLVVTLLLTFSTSWGWYFLLLICGSYILANLFSSVKIATIKGCRLLPLLLLAFTILHISYGSGFLIGLIKFRNRWGDKKGSVPVWNKNDVKE